MKNFKVFLIVLLCITTANAQIDCKAYVPTEKGAKWEITNYTAKGKITGKIQYELIDKIIEGNDVVFKIETKAFDKKNEEVYTNTFEAKCVNGVFELDMSFKMDGAQMQNYNDMDVEVDASNFELPDMDASAGTKLADGSLNVGVNTGGFNMNMTILITDRLVEARETLATPAGEFDCIVLSQNISTKMVIRVKAKSKEWYAQDIGLVRSESYNKKGKLQGYSELTLLQL